MSQAQTATVEELRKRGFTICPTSNGTGFTIYDKTDGFTLKLLRVIITDDDRLHLIAFDHRHCVHWEIRDLNLQTLPFEVIKDLLYGGENFIQGKRS